LRACAALSSPDAESALRDVGKARERGADLAEVRFDLMDELPDEIPSFESAGIPLIATLRPPEQGGFSPLGPRERLAFLKKAVRAGFGIVDLEYGSEAMAMAPRYLKGVQVICSYHDFEGTPDASRIVDILVSASSRADIAKAAFAVKSVSDLDRIVQAARAFSMTERDFALIGMGPLGEATRLLSHRMGCSFTYASLEEGKETAPGQVDVATLKSLGDDMVVTGLTGYPLGHSRSAPMHQAAFRSLGIPGRYLALPCQADELPALVNVVRALGMRGLNVTIPHKTAVMPLLDDLDPVARDAGAVNTIVNDGGVLTGRNTDVSGSGAALDNAGRPPIKAKALVIGAGGAARAVIAMLKTRGADVTVTARSYPKAMEVASELGVRAEELRIAPTTRFDLLVNCTPLGMKGFPSSLPISPEAIRPGQTVMDIVYEPEETPFLKEARARGAVAVPGMEMLIYQAIDAFEAWTGSRPEYNIMASAARAR